MSGRQLAWPVRASMAVYRALLRVFPRPFRDRFGREVAEAFGDGAQETWLSGGAPALAGLWLRTLRDLLTQGWHERRRAAATLSRRPPRGKAAFVDTLAQDIRFALRTLRRSPGFTAAIVATIALGIGANTAIFTALDHIVLRPLPFPGSERVVSLCETHPRIGEYCVASPPNVSDWVQMSDTLIDAGVARTWTYAMRDENGTTNVSSGNATPGYLRVHGLTPVLGRLLEDRDLADGDNRVVVLTYGFWQSRFAADAGVVGRQIVLDEEPFTIVGVLPAEPWIHSLGWVQVWTPLTATVEETDRRDWRGFVALGRLADGTTIARARDELEGARAALEQRYPEANRGWGTEMVWLRDRVAGPVRPILLVFLASVAFVLLIGCANVANLLLVRSTQRAQEFALRASLGAGRRRIVRQLLTESLLLSAIGGVVGIGLAAMATSLFVTLAPDNVPRLGEVGVDLRALGFALCLSAGTAFAFGLAPAWRAARTDLSETLKGARHGDPRSGGMRRILVVAEIALALMLLVGAGLLSRGFATLLEWSPGFDREGLVTTWGLANISQLKTGARINDLFGQVSQQIEAIPGVTAVGQTSAGPLIGGVETDLFVIEGRASVALEERPSVRWYDIDPGYFHAMAIPVVRGRSFAETDDDGSAKVAIINETMAHRHWPGGDPLGEHVTVDGRTVQIVGVARDVRPFEPDQATGPEIYWPKRQFPRGATYYVIRSELDLASLQQQVRQRLEPLGGLIDLSPLVPFQERTNNRLVSPRFNMILVAIFAGIAVALAAIGTSGVIARTVASRTHEIGIRMAVGARPLDVMATVIRSGMETALIGIGIGIGGALALGRFLEHLLHGLPPDDPTTYLGASVLFALIALAACALPAYRAHRLDPVAALRTE